MNVKALVLAESMAAIDPSVNIAPAPDHVIRHFYFDAEKQLVKLYVACLLSSL